MQYDRFYGLIFVVLFQLPDNVAGPGNLTGNIDNRDLVAETAERNIGPPHDADDCQNGNKTEDQNARDDDHHRHGRASFHRSPHSFSIFNRVPIARLPASEMLLVLINACTVVPNALAISCSVSPRLTI
jgi:hypothetical protein